MSDINRLLHFGASFTYWQGLDSIDEAYPNKVGRLLRLDSLNHGVPGASNLQILHDILNYKFMPGDVAILMWAPCNRDTLFEDGKVLQIGSWQNTEQAKYWMLTHSDSDLTVRTWYHIHHASLYLHSINIKHYNFAGYSRPLLMYKPDYIDIDLIDSNLADYTIITKSASDGHPGPQAHTMVANRMIEFIK